MGESDNLVSVILPVYNSVEYLKESIDSILGQTYPNLELILVDDGSDDRRVESIALSYGTKLHYYYKEHGGVASSLNFGIDLARGVYISRMDADDISVPSRIERQVYFMENNLDVGVLGTGMRCIDENGNYISSVSKTITGHEEILAEMLFSNPMRHPTIMFRRAILDQGWRYNLSEKTEDYDLWTRMIQTVKFANIREELLLYRIREDSVSKKYYSAIQDSAEKVRKKFIEKIFSVNSNRFHQDFFVCNGDICNQRDKLSVKYIEEHFSLLYNIYMQNLILLNINEKLLERVLIERWGYLIGMFGNNDTIKKYSNVQLLPDNNINFVKWLSDKYGLCEKDYINLKKELTNDLTKLIEDLYKFSERQNSYIIYGAGTRGKRLLSWVKGMKTFKWDLVAVADREKKYLMVDGTNHPVIRQDMITHLSYDYIIISSIEYYEEIKKELIDLGVNEEKIINDAWIYILERYDEEV